MKKFEFSLERIKSYKETCLEREKGILAKINQNLERIEKRINQTNNNIHNLNNELNEKTKEGAIIPQIKSFRFQIENLQNLVKELEKEKRRAEDEREIQLDNVIRVSGELKGYERLREKRYNEYKQYVNKTQQETISEFVQSKIAIEMISENDNQ